MRALKTLTALLVTLSFGWLVAAATPTPAALAASPTPASTTCGATTPAPATGPVLTPVGFQPSDQPTLDDGAGPNVPSQATAANAGEPPANADTRPVIPGALVNDTFGGTCGQAKAAYVYKSKDPRNVSITIKNLGDCELGITSTGGPEDPETVPPMGGTTVDGKIKSLIVKCLKTEATKCLFSVVAVRSA